MPSSISLVIPTLNAGPRLRTLVDSVLSQSLLVNEIIIVDSSSVDGSLDFISNYNNSIIRLYKIRKEDFDHGRTRDWAFRDLTTGEFVIFMTQDALLCDKDAILNIYNTINSDDAIAAVGARQIAYDTSSRQEKLIRSFNYPDSNSIWTSQDIERLGIKAFLISDVFAIYRRDAYLSVGGFDYPILTNEDMLIASRFLENGYKLGYTAEAAVFHSHDYTFKEEYKRNKIIGYTLEKFKDRFSCSEYGRGLDLVLYVSKNLLKGLHFISFISFGFSCFFKLLGNRNGRKEARRNNVG